MKKEKEEWKVGGWSLTGNNCRSFLVLEAISPVLYLPLNIYWHPSPPDVDDVDVHDGDDESIFEDEDDIDGGDDPDEDDDEDEDDHDDHQIVCTADSFEEIWLPLGADDDYDKDHRGDLL